MDLLDLFAKITLDDSEYNKGIDEATKKGTTFGSALKTAMGVGAAGFAAVTGATVALGKTITDGAAKTAAYGDEIDKQSQKLGISAEAYQEWDAILQHSGSSIDSMQTSMRTLANAAENGSEAFEALGLTQEEVASMSREDLFAETITALQNMEDENKRAQVAQKLFGRGAMELGALLNTSAEDTEEMRKRVHELGGVMSDDAVKSSAKFQDNLQDLRTAIDGAKRGVMSDFMPAISDVMGGLTEIFSGDSESGIAMINKGIDSVVSDLIEKLPEFLDFGISVGDTLLRALIDNLPKMLSAGGKLVGELVAGLIKAIPELIKSAPDLVMGIIEGLVSAWPDIKEAGVNLVKMVGEGLQSMIDSAKKWGSDLIGKFIEGIKAKWEALKQTVAETANKVKSYLGFSEPEEGPLSDFHTYAPDMMALFAKGIRDNAKLITDALDDSLELSPVIENQRGPSYEPTSGFGIADTAREIVINLTAELDGMVLARMLYRYNQDEALRLGTGLVEA